MAEAGASVALVDRDAEPLEVAADRLRAAGADVVRHVADVADEQAVAAVFESVRERMGPVTGAVACAGIDRGAALHELAASTWDEVVAVNLRGVFLTCRAALNHMLEAGGGSLVCVSSPLAFVGVPGGTGAYSATKGGVSALVRTLAVDYGSQGIRVNALLPGATETDLMWAGQPAEAVASLRETVNEQIPLGAARRPGRAGAGRLLVALGCLLVRDRLAARLRRGRAREGVDLDLTAALANRLSRIAAVAREAGAPAAVLSSPPALRWAGLTSSARRSPRRKGR